MDNSVQPKKFTGPDPTVQFRKNRKNLKLRAKILKAFTREIIWDILILKVQNKTRDCQQNWKGFYGFGPGKSSRLRNDLLHMDGKIEEPTNVYGQVPCNLSFSS